jgi:membrane-associated phospholipid phosphatase
MALVKVEPTDGDIIIADAISGHTGPGTERAAKALTWGADEHILSALAAGWWLCCRGKDAEGRRASDHVLLTMLVFSALPHLFKAVFDQERPYRWTIRGHWRGIPFSGKRLDAFPSGHAVHFGALASATTGLPAKQRNVIWSVSAGLVLTRTVLLAHWASDVAVGLAVGVWSVC